MKERLRKKEKGYLSLNCFDGREKERRKCKISQLQKLWRRGKWMILFMSRAARETSGLGLSPLETDRYGPPAFSSETNAWIIHRLLPRALLVWFFSFRRQKGFCNLNPNCEEREREMEIELEPRVKPLSYKVKGMSRESLSQKASHVLDTDLRSHWSTGTNTKEWILLELDVSFSVFFFFSLFSYALWLVLFLNGYLWSKLTVCFLAMLWSLN